MFAVKCQSEGFGGKTTQKNQTNKQKQKFWVALVYFSVRIEYLE